MSLVIKTNVASLEAQKHLSSSQSALSTSFTRLSSGFRINSAKDDAAGLAISESMRSQIRGYSVAERNANDAISMSQTAEGALGEVTSLLGRMRELAMQGSKGSVRTIDRQFLQTEFSNLQQEIGRIQSVTKFNGKSLIDENHQSTIDFDIGTSNGEKVSLQFGNVALNSITASSVSLGKFTTTSTAQRALDSIDSTITRVSTARATFGAAMNRLDMSISNIQTSRLNIAAANSRIRDTDVSEETAMLSRQQVLMQAGTAVLAQANSSPEMVAALLRG